MYKSTAKGFGSKARSAANRGSGGGTRRAMLQGIQKPKEELPSPDAKPEYFSVPGTVTFINPEQTMYYMAAPENSRKVGGEIVCSRGVSPCLGTACWR